MIHELKEIGKPFIVLLNCADPESEQAVETAREISEKYGVTIRTAQRWKESFESFVEDFLKKF